MSFGPLQSPPKNSWILGFQFSKWELTWGYGGSFPQILLHSWEHEMWLSGFTLGSHLCKPLGHKPKARVVIMCILYCKSIVIVAWSSFARIKSTFTKLVFIFYSKFELVLFFFCFIFEFITCLNFCFVFWELQTP
jgi:hypothetical protein